MIAMNPRDSSNHAAARKGLFGAFPDAALPGAGLGGPGAGLGGPGAGLGGPGAGLGGPGAGLGGPGAGLGGGGGRLGTCMVGREVKKAGRYISRVL